MSDTFERRSRESEKVVLDTLGAIRDDVAQLRQTTGEIRVALFGTPEQPWMGFIPRTEERSGKHDERIKRIEERVWIWLGVMAVLGPIFVVFVQKYVFSAVIK